MIQHLQGREKALEPFGWTGREAEWIALVCLHSGVFTRAQFCFYFNLASVYAHRFVRLMTEQGSVNESALPGSGHTPPGRPTQICRISNRKIYRALGCENIRHRKTASPGVLMRRLLSLDYILEHPELAWLPTEQEKVRCFEALELPRRLLPRRVYGGAVKEQKRYFALKLPVAVDTKTATFAYVDPGKQTDTEIRSWGEAHRRLWSALRAKGLQVRVVAIAQDHQGAERAEKVLEHWANGAVGAAKQGGEGPTQDDPAVAQEIKRIKQALIKVDRRVLREYGGINRATDRWHELEELPTAQRTNAVSIDGCATWETRRLTELYSDL